MLVSSKSYFPRFKALFGGREKNVDDLIKGRGKGASFLKIQPRKCTCLNGVCGFRSKVFCAPIL